MRYFKTALLLRIKTNLLIEDAPRLAAAPALSAVLILAFGLVEVAATAAGYPNEHLAARNAVRFLVVALAELEAKTHMQNADQQRKSDNSSGDYDECLVKQVYLAVRDGVADRNVLRAEHLVSQATVLASCTSFFAGVGVASIACHQRKRRSGVHQAAEQE